MHTAGLFYTVCFGLGFSIGYWALFVTIAAEQFGTNLRATVATTVPNFVRGSVTIITPLFILLKNQYGIVSGAAMVGSLTIIIALLALWKLNETFAPRFRFPGRVKGNNLPKAVRIILYNRFVLNYILNHYLKNVMYRNI